MKLQISIFSYLLLSFLIFSFSSFLIFFWNNSLDTFKKQFTRNFLEYLKESIEASTILGLSSCNFCSFEIIFRIKSFLPKTYTTIAITSTDYVNYFFSEEKISSSFYNLTKVYTINAFASLNRNLAINFSCLDSSISIFNID